MNLSGDTIGYVSAFLGGVVVSFSPCVYPLIPITLGFIGVKAEGSRWRGLFLSLIYVSGIAITYATLGLFAALSGKLFGRVSSHPLSPFILGNVCIISGLSFLDVVHFNFAGLQLHNKIKNKGGYIAVFLLGLASGLIAGPCTAPALGAILALVASRQNIVYGVSLLLVFAYGMGFLLILAGTFGVMFLSFPKAAAWIVRIKKLGGFILIGAGEYFLLQAGRLMW
ncbi:MAG: cytochrome c biogenesis protein CcdA [Candidatus Omnitrophota bacterium]